MAETEMASDYVACLTVSDLIAELSKQAPDAELCTTGSLLAGARVITQTTGRVLVCAPARPIFKRDRPTP